MWKVLQWLAKVPKDQGDSIVKIDEICSGWQVIVICKSAVFAKRPLLVGGLAHLDCFSICWEFHHPNWLSYFSEGWNHQPDWDVSDTWKLQMPCTVRIRQSTENHNASNTAKAHVSLFAALWMLWMCAGIMIYGNTSNTLQKQLRIASAWNTITNWGTA